MAGHITQVSYNGYTIPGGRIQKIGGLDRPEFRVSDYDYPGRDGGSYIRTLYGRRIISVEWLIYESTLAAYILDREQVLDSFDPKDGLNTLSITVNDDDVFGLEAVTREIDLPQRAAPASYATARVEMVAYDPVLTRSTFSYSTGVTTAEGGGTLPATLPMSLSAGTSSNPSFNNSGNTPAHVVWRVTGPGTTFVVQNLTTGESFTLSLTLTAGQYVEVDTKLRTVKQGGFTNQIDKFSGDFMKLNPGANLMAFNAASGTDSGTALSATGSHSYVGI